MMERTAQTRDPGSFQRRPTHWSMSRKEHVPKKLLDFFEVDVLQIVGMRVSFSITGFRVGASALMCR